MKTPRTKPPAITCPNCGKTANDKNHTTGEPAVIATRYAESGCVVQCNWCGLSGPLAGTVKAAIAAWRTLLGKARP